MRPTINPPRLKRPVLNKQPPKRLTRIPNWSPLTRIPNWRANLAAKIAREEALEAEKRAPISLNAKWAKVLRKEKQQRKLAWLRQMGLVRNPRWTAPVIPFKKQASR
jgi:hypothetical protein